MKQLCKSKKYLLLFSFAILLLLVTILLLFRNISEQKTTSEQPRDVIVVNTSTVETEIYWKTNPDNIHKIEYKKETDSGLYKTATTSIMNIEIPNEEKIYHTTLTDLEPNTKYLFRIQSEKRIWNDEHSFKTKSISDEVHIPEVVTGQGKDRELLLIDVEGELHLLDTQYHGTWALDTKGRNYSVKTYANYTTKQESEEKLLSALHSPIYAQSGANCQRNVKVNVSTTPSKSKVVDILNRWVASCPLGGYPEECYEDVYCRALKHGINPAFAITIWSNESGGSNYAYTSNVEDFGIHGNPSAPVANFDKQIEFFLENIAQPKYIDACQWVSGFEEKYGPLQLNRNVIMWGAKFLTGKCTTEEQLKKGLNYMNNINNIYGWYTNKTLTWPFTVTKQPNACSYANASTNTTYNSCSAKGTPSPTPTPPTPTPPTPTTRKWLAVTGIGNDGKKISPEVNLKCESLGWNTSCTCIWNYNIKPGEHTKDIQIGQTCTVDGKVISDPKPTPKPDPKPQPEPEGCCIFNDTAQYKEKKECDGEIIENVTKKYCQVKHTRINMIRGVNFFQAPFVLNSSEVKITTAKELIETLNYEILAVGLFRNDQWEKIVKNENKQIHGVDFNLTPGEVYIVISDNNIEISLQSIEIPYDIDVAKLTGWNLVPTSLFKSSNSMTSHILLNTEYSYIKQIAVWNSKQNLFDYTLRDNTGDVFGDSISISQQIGVFVKIP